MSSLPAKATPKHRGGCKGYVTDDPTNGRDYGCGYDTAITCDECRYCIGSDGKPVGRKDPAAKCNSNA